MTPCGERAIAAMHTISQLPRRADPQQEIEELRLVVEETLGRIDGPMGTPYDDARQQVEVLKLALARVLAAVDTKNVSRAIIGSKRTTTRERLVFSRVIKEARHILFCLR